VLRQKHFDARDIPSGVPEQSFAAALGGDFVTDQG
jgi:hypothetical protein